MYYIYSVSPEYRASGLSFFVFTLECLVLWIFHKTMQIFSFDNTPTYYDDHPWNAIVVDSSRVHSFARFVFSWYVRNNFTLWTHRSERNSIDAIYIYFPSFTKLRLIFIRQKSAHINWHTYSSFPCLYISTKSKEFLISCLYQWFESWLFMMLKWII